MRSFEEESLQLAKGQAVVEANKLYPDNYKNKRDDKIKELTQKYYLDLVTPPPCDSKRITNNSVSEIFFRKDGIDYMVPIVSISIGHSGYSVEILAPQSIPVVRR